MEKNLERPSIGYISGIVINTKYNGCQTIFVILDSLFKITLWYDVCLLHV